MPEIRIEVRDEAVRKALNDLAGKVRDLSPVMRIIGEYMVRSTEERFGGQGPAPSGAPWAPLAKSTLRKKKHSKILTESGALRGDIHYRLLGTRGVSIGTTGRVPYAAIHQFGGVIEQAARSEIFVRNRYARGAKKGSFKKGTTAGRGFTFGARRIAIPARPFLGVSATDSNSIVGHINRYLASRWT